MIDKKIEVSTMVPGDLIVRVILDSSPVRSCRTKDTSKVGTGVRSHRTEAGCDGSLIGREHTHSTPTRLHRVSQCPQSVDLHQTDMRRRFGC